MVTATYPQAPDLSAEDYIVLGLATCFLKEDGKLHEVQIIEPIPSAALEALTKGVPTSYQMAYATHLGAVVNGETLQKPADFPEAAQWCDEFANRVISAARTYKAHPQAQEHIPVGSPRQDFNYSVERKRVLNSQRIVRTEDNVKQHKYTHEVL